MKNIFIFSVLLLTAKGANSQNLIAVNHNGSSNFYTNIDTAISKAANGDTIYLPGGVFTLNTSIKKELHIYGAGLHPDSAKTTTPTFINGNAYGNISIEKGASYGTLEGVYTSGGIYFGGYNHTDTNKLGVENYTINRCYIGGVTYFAFGIGGVTFYDNSQKITIKECVFGGVGMNSIQKNFLISNCIISGEITLFSSQITNCILTYNSYCNYGCHFTVNGENSQVQNCIFYNAYYNDLKNYLFYNNVNGPGNGYNSPSIGCYSRGDFGVTDWADIFINVPASSRDNYMTNDYHLKSNFAGKNYGTDGTDVGIYGGPFPWKEGNVPVNPHIYFKDIPQVTDNVGKLPVKIKVKAQNK